MTSGAWETRGDSDMERGPDQSSPGSHSAGEPGPHRQPMVVPDSHSIQTVRLPDVQSEPERSVIATRGHARGMNAALARAEPSAQKRLPHASTRQLMAGIALVVVAALVAWFSITRLLIAPGSFSGSIQSASSVSVNFPNTATLVSLNVKPGDHVTHGQVLAQEDSTAAEATLQSDKAVLDAAQTKLNDLQGSSAGAAQRQQVALQVNQAQAQLANAQQAVRDAEGVGASLLAQAQAQQNQASSQLSQDQVVFDSTCPASAVSSTTCVALATKLQSDSTSLSSAQANVQHVQATNQQTIDAANGTVAQDQAALALSQNQGAVLAAPASPADLDTARVAVNQAQAQVVTDQAALNALTLVSPLSGIVVQVAGSVGELVGPSGVHSFTGPSPPASNSSQPSFSLFPSSPSASSSNGSNTPLESLITVQGGGMVAAAQVTEDQVPKLSAGQQAHVVVNALGISVPGRVEKIIAAPVNASSSVSYEVLIKVKSWPRHVLPGMSISATFGPG